MPLVSVVMPSYNHERFISESIESILRQTFGDLELLIVDDASVDGSRRIIEDFARKDGRIRAQFHDANLGIARTLNDGLAAARGKFVAFTASDDVWVAGKLERQMKVLEGRHDLIVWSEGEVIDAQGNPTGDLFTVRCGASRRTKSGHILNELLKGNFVFGSTTVFKRDNLGSLRFDEGLKYLNDYKFQVDLASRYEYHFIPEPLAKYRVHGANTDRDKVGNARETVVVSNRFLDLYGDQMQRDVKSAVYVNMARAHLQLGKPLQATRWLLRGAALNPSPELLGLLSKETSAYLLRRSPWSGQ